MVRAFVSRRRFGILPLLVLMATGGFLPGAARGGEPDAGTFSIVAFDRETGEIGVAVQSRAFNVGQAVPWVEAGVGGIATQASTNESFGPKGLALLRAGMSAGEVLEWLIAHDEGSKERQIGIVDASGRSAAHTGSGCLEWAGHRNGEGYAIQGNILAGAEVVAAMEKAYLETRGEMAVRLLAALRAAQAAGGDRRGQQSAALLVARPSAEFPEYRHRYVDLRVDDHPEPIREIERLFGVAEGTDLTEAHARFAEEYRRAGKTAAAERELGWLADSVRRALATERPDPSALNGLAWTLASAGLHLAEALQAAETAARLEPDSWEILDTLAEVHFRLGNRERAIEVEEKAAAMAPDVRYLRDQIERFRTGEIPGPTE